jgi:hypothetical protein
MPLPPSPVKYEPFAVPPEPEAPPLAPIEAQELNTGAAHTSKAHICVMLNTTSFFMRKLLYIDFSLRGKRCEKKWVFGQSYREREREREREFMCTTGVFLIFLLRTAQRVPQLA